MFGTAHRFLEGLLKLLGNAGLRAKPCPNCSPEANQAGENAQPMAQPRELLRCRLMNLSSSRPRSAGWSALFHHRVGQLADAVNLDGHTVAGLQEDRRSPREADTVGCAGEDHRARVQNHASR